MLRRIWVYITLSWDLFRQGVLAVAEYKTAFISQFIGMMLNDVCWIVLWYTYSLRFPDINGWHAHDSFLVFCFGCFSFGIATGFCGGVTEISRKITEGELDYYLSLPKNPLWHLLFARPGIAGLGDVFFGIVGFLILYPDAVQKLPLFVVAGIFAGVALVAFTVILHSLTFYFGNFEAAANQVFWSLITFAVYPYNTFQGALLMVTKTILPAFFIFTVPIESVRHFAWSGLSTLLIFTCGISLFAVFFFKAGLKRYESGNLVQVRL
jgi:ABC-2 type transport system permease protein